MPPPPIEPIGLQLTRTARVLGRALDDALAAEGGSLPVWSVLASLMGRRHGAQRSLAAAVGIEGPTLTHHLARMEAANLVERHRDPENRRVQRVELTVEGEALFARLRRVVVTFDQQLRTGLDADDVKRLAATLERVRANVEHERLPA
ncbi:MAG: MarR family transcriptional regulator [Acidimicrobiia bacterium]